MRAITAIFFLLLLAGTALADHKSRNRSTTAWASSQPVSVVSDKQVAPHIVTGKQIGRAHV